MTIEEMTTKLENMLLHRRYIHSLNVMKTAVELARKYDEDTDKAAKAGLLHDCARDMEGFEILKLCEINGVRVDEIARAQPELLHGQAGAIIASTMFGVCDRSILDAISYHTIGKENMSMLEKIIFISDFIEPGRSFPGVDKARELAYIDINGAVLFSLNKTLKYVMTRGDLIHPDTIFARNYIIKFGLAKQTV
jgi:predicted HD superfamily hydrolase involved in NAD metabolism